jgi:hypothetical protein
MSDTTIDTPTMGWSGVMMVLNRWAGELDRRIIREADWPTLPRTFGLNHDSTEAIGSVDHMELRSENGVDFVWGHGRFSNTPEGVKAALQLEEQVLRTVSVELRDGVVVQSPVYDDAGMEVGVATDWQKATIGSVAFERQPAHAGAVIMSDPLAAMFDPGDFPVDPGLGTLEADDINLAPDDEYAGIVDVLDGMGTVAARQAAIGPDPYPARYFTKLAYPAPSRLTISPDGEVTGHVAVWGRRYRQNGGGDWVASPSGDLSEWLVGHAALDDGTTCSTGVIVSDAMHQWGPTRAASMRRQIEDTSLQVMQVYAWEDDHGIAVHGSTLPGVTPEQAVRAMAGCPSIVTMDQRDGRGYLPVAVLCVSTCGLKPGDSVVQIKDGQQETRVLAASAAGPPALDGESCGCGEPAACSCHQASAVEPDPEPVVEAAPVVDLAALAAADRRMAEARLKAATAPKPKR